MGNSQFSTFIYIGLIPGMLTGLALAYFQTRFELSTLSIALWGVPVWIAVLSAWVYGMAGIASVIGAIYAIVFPIPRCQNCDKPITTRLAKQCLHCGADWHHT